MDGFYEFQNGFSFILGEYAEIRNEILIDTYGSKSKGFNFGAFSLIYQQIKSLGVRVNTYLENFNSYNNICEFTSVTYGIPLSSIENLPSVIYALGRILMPYGINCILIEQDGFKLVDLRTKTKEEGEISDSYKEIKIKSLSSLNKTFITSYIDAILLNLEKSEGLINIDYNDIKAVTSNSDIVYFYNGYYNGSNFSPLKLSIGPADSMIINITGNKDLSITLVDEILAKMKKINEADISSIFGTKENDKLPLPELLIVATKKR